MTEWVKDTGGIPPVVLLPAIQHTGSRFVRWDVLKRYQHCQLNEPPHKRTVYYEHLSAERKCHRFIPLLGKYPIVSSLRHPRRVFKSWQKRGQKMAQCIEEWSNLIEMIDPHDPYYLPIDTEDRQDYLDRINADLGLNITTDWLPRGNAAGTMLMRPEDIILPDEAEAFIESIQHFTDRFWRNTVQTQEITGAVFRNLTRRCIAAYGYVFTPKGKEGDTRKVKEPSLIEKFRLYDTLEMVEVDQAKPEAVETAPEIPEGFKVDKRWSQERLAKEIEAWRTQQHN